MAKARSKYSPRLRVAVAFNEVGKTDPVFKADCDVNLMLQKYQSTGTLRLNTKTPIYDDFSHVPEYMDAQQILIKANEQFEGLPAKVRKKFDNDPKNFLEFATNPENQEEMISLGLIDAPPPVPPPVEPVVPESEPTA